MLHRCRKIWRPILEILTSSRIPVEMQVVGTTWTYHRDPVGGRIKKVLQIYRQIHISGVRGNRGFINMKPTGPECTLKIREIPHTIIKSSNLIPLNLGVTSWWNWNMGVSKKLGIPQNGSFIMENPIKMGWFGGILPTILGNTHIPQGPKLAGKFHPTNLLPPRSP